MQFDWKSVGAVALLGLGLAGCGGSGAGTATQDSGSGGGGGGGKAPVASCAASGAQPAGKGFSPSGTMRLQNAQALAAGGFKVVQTIPAPGTEAADPNSAVVLFFNNVIDESSVTENTLSLMHNGVPVPTNVNYSCSDYGNSIVALTPVGTFGAGANVTVDWAGLASATGSMVMPAGSAFDVATDTASLGSPVFSPDEVTLPPGVKCSGDCGVRSGWFGDAPELSTPHSVYFSTGGSVGAGTAKGSTTSMLTLSGMENNGNTLTFKYRFISAELPEFIGSIFDDVFMVVVGGPNGKKVVPVTSVNTLADVAYPDELEFGTFDQTGSVNDTNTAGPSGALAMMSNVLTGSISTEGLGSPITVIFVASDVGDTIFDTVIQLNDIAIETLDTTE